MLYQSFVIAKKRSFIVFYDSMSSLEALSGFRIELNLVCGILKDRAQLTDSAK